MHGLGLPHAPWCTMSPLPPVLSVGLALCVFLSSMACLVVGGMQSIKMNLPLQNVRPALDATSLDGNISGHTGLWCYVYA